MLTLLTILAAGALADADIRPILRHQGFDGPLSGTEKIAYVGKISQGGDDYQIYVFSGVVRAAVVDHGINRMIVILNGSIFLGQYYIPSSPECSVQGRTVVCDTDAPGNLIEFTPQGPPEEIWFDGEVLNFVVRSAIR